MSRLSRSVYTQSSDDELCSAECVHNAEASSRISLASGICDSDMGASVGSKDWETGQETAIKEPCGIANLIS